MTENNNNQLCVCGELSCTGCSCSTDCSFSPGHTDGTIATDPLAALIEAAIGLLDNLASNEYYDDREQEPTYGQVYPDVRRLNATIAYAQRKRKATEESLQHVLTEQATLQQAALAHLKQIRSQLFTLSEVIMEKPQVGESINGSNPDNGGTVVLSVFKVAGGGMIAIDTSYLL